MSNIKGKSVKWAVFFKELNYFSINSSLLFHFYNMSRLHHTKQLISERLSDSAVVPEAWWQDEDGGLLASRLVCPLFSGADWRLVWPGWQPDLRHEKRKRTLADVTWGPRTSLCCWAADALPQHLFLLPLPGKTSQGTLATHGCICVPQVQGLPPLPPPSNGRLRQVLAWQQRQKFSWNVSR